MTFARIAYDVVTVNIAIRKAVKYMASNNERHVTRCLGVYSWIGLRCQWRSEPAYSRLWCLTPIEFCVSYYVYTSPVLDGDEFGGLCVTPKSNAPPTMGVRWISIPCLTWNLIWLLTELTPFCCTKHVSCRRNLLIKGARCTNGKQQIQ